MKLSIQNQAIVDAFDEGLWVDSEGNIFGKSGKQLSGYIDEQGYRCVTLNKAYGRTSIRTHRLIAYSLYGDAMFEGGMLIRHLDDNKLNNHPSNLFIGTASENARDRMFRGKLHANQVKVIYNSALGPQDLARIFNVTTSTIYDIRNGKTWSDITNHKVAQ